MFCLTLVFIVGLTAQALAGIVPSDEKIVGGVAANISAFPYQVSLQRDNSHFCGGTIFNSRIIVTAAHCIKPVLDPTTISIRYGSSVWSTGGTLVGVIKALVHPNYSTSTMANDIALLKTADPIVWGTNVRSIYLADADPVNNTMAKISGWGTLFSGAPTIPSQLQMASVKIISRDVCNSGMFGYGGSILNTMLCADSIGIDACQGDSGGPLVAGGAQVGIVSWGIGCADPLYPGVYASVAALKSFVVANKNM